MTRHKSTSTVFGKRLREARLLREIPQDKLGVLIGLDETVASARISRYETGQHEPPYKTAQQLAKALNVPVAYLYCEDNELIEIILKLGAASKERLEAIKELLQ